MRLRDRAIAVVVSVAMAWNGSFAPVAEGIANVGSQDGTTLTQGADGTEDVAAETVGSTGAASADATPADTTSAGSTSVEQTTQDDAEGTVGDAASEDDAVGQGTAPGVAEDPGMTSATGATGSDSAVTEDNAAATGDDTTATGESATAPEDSATPTGESATAPEDSATPTRDDAAPVVPSDTDATGSETGDASAGGGAGQAQAPASSQEGTTLERTLRSVDGHSYTVRLVAEESAGIPADAKLQVTEVVQEPAKEERDKHPEAYKDRPYETEAWATEAEMAHRAELLSQALATAEEDYVAWAKYLQVRVVASDGSEVRPSAPVAVEVETDAVAPEMAPALEAALVDGEPSAPQVTARASRIEMEPDGKGGEREHVWSSMTVATDRLGELALAAVATPVRSWELRGGTATVLAPRSGLDVRVDEHDASAPEGGDLEPELGISASASPVAGTPDATSGRGVRLWLRLAPVEGATGALSAWREGTQVLAPGAATPAALAPGDRVDLLFDPSYSATELVAGDVTIVGELPEGAEAQVADRVVDFDDPASLPGAPAAEGDQLTTVAAYDIAVEVGGVSYVADESRPVEATVSGAAVSAADPASLEVWRVGEGGATALESSPGEGAVSFDVSEPGTYLVVERTTLAGTVTASDGRTYEVSVTYGPESAVPAGASLRVRELPADELPAYEESAADALGNRSLTYFRAFDISILDPSGEEVKPQAEVEVSIRLADDAVATAAGDPAVLHFVDDAGAAPDVIASEVASAATPDDSPEPLADADPAGAGDAAPGTTFTFSTDSFSVYGIAYTVDFHWGDYTYRMPGEGELLLSQLLAELGIDSVQAADVVEASFSNPSLVLVERLEDASDWRLVSLAPFDSEEELTLRLAGGLSVSIRVTDAQVDPSSPTANYRVVWDDASTTTRYYESLADVASAINTAVAAYSYPATVYLERDVTETTGVTFTKNYLLSIDGQGNKITYNTDTANPLITRSQTSDSAIRNIVLAGSASAFVSKGSSGLLTLHGVTIEAGSGAGNMVSLNGGGVTRFISCTLSGGSVAGSLVKHAGTGPVSFLECEVEGNEATGHIIETTGSSSLSITGGSLSGSVDPSAGSLIKKSSGDISLVRVALAGGTSSSAMISDSGTGTLSLANCTLDGNDVTGHLVEKTGNGEVSISGGSVTGSRAASAGSLIRKTGSGAMTLRNVTLTGGASSGALVYDAGSSAGSVLTLADCTVIGGQSTGNLVEKAANADVHVSGGTIVGSSVASDGALVTKSVGTGTASITLDGVTLSGNRSKGPLVSDTATGTLTIVGCTLNGSTDASANALVRKANSGAVSISDTQLTRNAVTGAAYKNTGNGASTLTNVVFDGSGTSAVEPLVMAGSGDLTLSGLTVRGHAATASGVHAVSAGNASKITVSGSMDVTGNTSGGNAANLYIGSKMLNVTGSMSGALGISQASTAASGAQFGEADKTVYLGMDTFVSDSDPTLMGAYKTTGSTTERKILWGAGTPAGEDDPNPVCQLVVGSKVIKRYASLQSALNDAPNGSRVEMLKDYAIPAEIVAGTGKAITLTTAAEYEGSGAVATITRASSLAAGKRMFTINAAGSSLTVRDLVIDGGNVNVTVKGALFSVENGHLTLESGAILQNGVAYGHEGEGGGVYVYSSNAHLTMKDGCVIQDCKAYRNSYYAGGGVCVVNSNNFRMEGGTIRNCEAVNKSGGAIGVDHGDTIYISGGLITGCTAADKGGAIEVHGYVVMSGGTITGCSSVSGGAINFFDNSTGTDNNDKRLYLSGNPVIYNNLNAAGKQCNVDIYHHYSGSVGQSMYNIWLKDHEGLGPDAHIGVTAGQNSAEDSKVFGHYSTGVDLMRVGLFTNDADETLVGTDGGSNNLVWAKGIHIVARMYTVADPDVMWDIADAEGRYLFDYQGITSGDRTVTEGIAAVEGKYRMSQGYAPMEDADAKFVNAIVEPSGGQPSDDVTFLRSKLSISGTNRTYTNSYSTATDLKTFQKRYPDYIPARHFVELDSADTLVLYYEIDPKVKITDAEGGILYLPTGNPAVFAKLETALAKVGELYHRDAATGILTAYEGRRQVQMLVSSYDLTSGATASGSRDVTLTTASADDAEFPGKGGTCVIANKGVTGASMIATGLANLTLDKVTLDGKGVETSSDGALVKVTKPGATLTIQEGATLKGGSSSGKGGALYLADGAALSMTGGSISASRSTNGGAINVGGAQARLNFSGSPRVYDNPGSSGSQKNVCLDVDSDAVINLTGTIEASSRIGVFVADGVRDARGIAGTSFGTAVSSKPNYPKVFVNDRTEELFGSYKSSSTDSRLYWNEARTVMVPLIVQKMWRDQGHGQLGGNYDDATVSFAIYGKIGETEELLTAYSVSSPKADKQVSTLRASDTRVLDGETVPWARLVYVPRKNAAEANYDSYFMRETGNTAQDGSLVAWCPEYSAEKGSWQEVTDGYVDGYIKLHRTSIQVSTSSPYVDVKHIEFYFWDDIATKDNYYCAQVDLGSNLLTWTDEGDYYIKVRLPDSLDFGEARLIFDGYNGSGNPNVLTLANEESLKSGVNGHGLVYGIVTCTTSREPYNPDGAPAFKQGDMTTSSPSFDGIEFLHACPEGVTAQEGDATLYTFPHEQADARLIVTNNAYICKIEDSNAEGGVKADGRDVYEHGFPTLNAAVAYARAQQTMSATNSVKIQMLVDYEIPKADKVTLDKAKDNITITTAATSGGVYNFTPTFTAAQGRRAADSRGIAILKRGWDGGNAAAEAMFYLGGDKVSPSLTTENIIFDGEDSNDVVEETGALVQRTGRAVYVNAGGLMVKDGSTFRNLKTPNVGGAIYSAQVKNTKIQGSEPSAILFENCRATGSGSDYDGGGAIAFIQSSKDGGLVEGATFIDCYTDAAGGAIYVRTMSTTKSFVVTNCVFDGHEDLDRIAANRVNAKWGGAIYIWDGWFSMTDCDFTDCTATEDGGAVSVHSGGGDKVELIENCSFNGHDTLPNDIVNAKSGGAIGLTNVGQGVDVMRDITVKNYWINNGNGGGFNVPCEVREVGGLLDISNCYTTNGNGGGIFFSSIKKLTDDVHFVIDNCHASGNGGGIYFSGYIPLIKESEFTDCYAGGTGGSIHFQGSGGKIFAFDSCAFNGHDNDLAITTVNAANGGGIYINDGSLEFVDCTFKNLTAKTRGGAIDMEGGGSDHLTLTDCIIDGNDGKLTKDGATVKNAAQGGGIWINADNGTILNDVTIKNCQASGNGGGIYFGESTDSLTETSGTVKLENCYTTGGKGGGAFFGTNATFGKAETASTVTFTGCHADSTSTAEGGGGAWFKYSPTLKSGTTLNFDSCYSASYGGGAWFNDATTLNIGTISFTDCYAAKRGGGAYFANTAKLTDATSFKACHTDTAGTSDGGGGAYFASTATLNGTGFEDCHTQANGGAMYLANSGTLTDVQVDGHKDLAAATTNAVKGGAFYLVDAKGVTLHGGEYKNCSASGANGGAVNVGGSTAVLSFEADVVVYNNPQTAAEGVQQKNVVLDYDTNAVIKTTGTALSPDAHIGVYVPDGTSLYDKHGKIPLQFGTENTSKANLDRFTNDRDETLFGTEHLDTGIYWGKYICKVVDTDADKAEHLFTTLMNAVKYARANRAKAFDTNGFCTVQMLVDYAVYSFDVVTLNTANDKFVFTTAKGQAEAEADGEEYYFTDTLEGKADSDKGTAILARGWNGGSTKAQSLFYVTNGSATLSTTNLIMDGKNGETQQTGRAICVNGGNLSVGTGSVFRNFYINGGTSSEPGDGGAIYIPSAVSSAITGASFIDCHTESNNGGSIYFYAGGKTLAVSNCVFDGHETLGGEKKNANSGGAIYVGEGRINVSRSTFRDLWTSGAGGAIYMNGGGGDWLEISDSGIDGHDSLDASRPNATQGGGVWINASMTQLYGVSITDCRTSGDGGGLYANASSPITETTGAVSFTDCYTTGGKGGGAYFGNTATFGKAGTTGNTVTFTRCHGDSTSYSNGGGAWFGGTLTFQPDTELSFDSCYAASYGGGAWFNAATTLSNAPISFKDCYATKQGGGAYFYTTSTLNTSVSFTDCHADTTGTSDGGGGAWFNGAVTFSANADLSFTDCYTSACGGGARFNSTATVNSGAKLGFDSCHAASYGGGAYFNGAATVNDGSIVTFEECYAAVRGGGAYLQGDGVHTLTDVSFTNCKAGWAWDESTQQYVSVAGGLGGGLYKRDNTLNLTDAIFTGCYASSNGGAVYYEPQSDTFNLNSGTYITGCTTGAGGRGSAIFVNSSGKLNFNGGTASGVCGVSITGNRGAGAVEVNSDSAILTFGGNVLLHDNYANLTSGEGTENTQKNLVLDRNVNTVIKTATTGLGADARIGVYVTDAQWDRHGKLPMPFGTWQTTSVNLERFTNDRDEELFGTMHPGDNLIYWGTIICKIVDTNGREQVFATLMSAVSYARANTPTAYVGGVCTVQMLVDYVIPKYDVVTLDKAADSFLFTTAATKPTATEGAEAGAGTDGNAPEPGETESTSERYFFVPTFTEADGRRSTDSRAMAILQRGWDGGATAAQALFYLNNGSAKLATTNIALDGMSPSTTGALTQHTGRAIYANAGLTEIRGGSTFRNFSTAEAGGAVFAQAITVEGTETSKVRFENCKTTGSTKAGGAVYAAGNVNVSHATFVTCTATGTGGAIHHNGADEVSISNAAFGELKEASAAKPASALTKDDVDLSQKSTGTNGGAVYSNTTGNFALTDCAFYGSYASGIGGAVYLEKSSASIVETYTRCVFVGCETPTSGSNKFGGAIGANNGGATVHGQTKVIGCVFTDCKSMLGGAILARGNEVKVQESSFTRCSASTYYGGAIYADHTGTKPAVELTRSTFTGCTALTGGAIANGDNGWKGLTVSGCTFDGCAATGTGSYVNGGAIADRTAGSTAIEIRKAAPVAADLVNGIPAQSGRVTVFSDCYTTRSGGAIWSRAPLTLDGVTINGHTEGGLVASTANAQLGGAIYAENSVTIKGGEIKNCSASTAATGGAVNLASGKTVSFEGDAIVYNNISTKSGSQVQANVVLDQSLTTKINTTVAGLGENAHIGVYVTGTATGTLTDPYKTYGQFEQDFGTWPADGSTEHFDAFTNDRNGLYGEVSTNPNKIRWTSYLCKLTVGASGDANGRLLYVRAGNDADGYTYEPAVYKTFQAALGAGGVGATLYYPSDPANPSGAYAEYASTGSNAINVELLKNYRQPESDAATNGAGRSVTLKTAANKQDGNKSADDIYIYNKGNDAGVDPSRATVRRAYTGASMFTQNTASGSLTLTGVILDGNKGAVIPGSNPEARYTSTTGGGIVRVAAGTLNVREDATLRDSAVVAAGGGSADGGAVYVADGARVTMDAGAITGATGANGGALYLAAGATGELSGGTISGNTAAGGHGGGIYLAEGAKMAMAGGSITGNSITGAGQGAGIYLKEGSELKLSGSPDFGGRSAEAGNRLAAQEAEETGRRQDIYIAGYLGKIGDGNDDPKPATSLVVAGVLYGSKAEEEAKGSIWVGAEVPADNAAEDMRENNHWDTLKQFAVFDRTLLNEDDTPKLTDDALKRVYVAFRNATTTAEYFGSDGEDPAYLYWDGVRGQRKVILKKVDAEDNKPLEGAEFRITNANWADLHKTDGEGDVYISDSQGVYFVGDLAYGTYYLVETEFPAGYKPAGYDKFDEATPTTWVYYKLTVGEPGTFVGGDEDKEIGLKGTYIEGPFRRTESASTSDESTITAGDMWGRFESDNIHMGPYTGKRYEITYGDVKYVGKYAYDWVVQEGDNDDTWSLYKGALLWIDGQFRIMRSDKLGQNRTQLASLLPSDTGTLIPFGEAVAVLDEDSYVSRYESQDLRNYKFDVGTFIYTRVIGGKREFWTTASEGDLGSGSPNLDGKAWMDITEMFIPTP